MLISAVKSKDACLSTVTINEISGPFSVCQNSQVLYFSQPFSSFFLLFFYCVFYRPPGHHSQRSEANGFCVFNNVAIAALYAKKHYNLNR